MSFIIVMLIIWLILSTGSYHGYRRSYYGGATAVGLLVVFLAFLGIGILLIGPNRGYYGPIW